MSVTILALHCCFFVLHTSTSFRSLDWLRINWLKTELFSPCWPVLRWPSGSPMRLSKNVGVCLWRAHQCCFATYCDCVLWNFYGIFNIMLLRWFIGFISYLGSALNSCEVLQCRECCSLINKLVLRVETSSLCDGKRTMVIKKEGFGPIQHSYIKGFEKENKDVCWVISGNRQPTPPLIKWRPVLTANRDAIRC